jgi:hypothetical protein
MICRTPFPPHASFDLLPATKTWHNKPRVLAPIQAPSHQDDGVSFNKLADLAQLNVIADLEAKAIRRRHSRIAPCSSPIEGEGWLIWLGNDKLSCCEDSRIIQHVHDPELICHWKAQGRTVDETEQLINWDAQLRARDSSTSARKIWIVKIASRFCIVGHAASHCEVTSTNSCP